MYSRIIGTGSYLPAKVLTNRDLERMVDTSDEWIVTRTGIRQRHIAADARRRATWRCEARAQALAAAGIARRGSRPDHRRDYHARHDFPQHRLHPAGQAGCARLSGIRRAGRVQRLRLCADHRRQFIRAGQCRYALVVGAEVYSRILDWDDRSTCVLFGDGAGAVVLAASDTPGLLASRLHADGSLQPRAVGAGPGLRRQGARQAVRYDGGQAVFKFAVKVLEKWSRKCSRPADMRQAAHRLADSAPGQSAHHRSHCAETGLAHGKSRRHRGPACQHLGGIDSARAG